MRLYTSLGGTVMATVDQSAVAQCRDDAGFSRTRRLKGVQNN
jgi:hypothetical protein